VPLPPIQKPKRKRRKVKQKVSPHLQGKAFEREISKSLEFCEKHLSNFMWRRFFDTRDYVRINRFLQVPHQPADWWAVHNGVAYFLEAKSSKSLNSYRIAYVKPDQLDDLLRLEKCGARSILLMCRRVPRQNRTFAIPASVFDALKQEAEEDGKRSIKWARIRDCGTELRLIPGKGKIWDLRPIFS